LRKKQTISSLQRLKGVEKLSMITAYDSLFAKIFDGEVDLILVGDSLNMSFRGENDTLSADIGVMLYHTKAVCNGAKNTFIVADMPFGTYTNREEALQNAIRFYRETGADSVKIEGGVEREETIRHLVENGIAVVGHIGLMPQSFRSEGGYFVKGKDEESREKVLQDALAVERAGAFMVVVEGVKEDLAREITESISIPVIGIGAGKFVDGQVLVWSDMLGFFEEFKPKFVKRYMSGGSAVREAVQNYNREVKSGEFPEEENIY
jgi:3-methyl-2-oxobutanoate hydroxymethyltransferase